MVKDRQKLYQIYHTILCMVLTGAVTVAINHYFVLKVQVLLCLFFCFIPATLVYLFDINKKNTISYLILVSIFPILGFIFWLRKYNPISGVYNLIDWCNTYDRTDATYQAGYARFLVFLIALIGTIIFYLLMKKQAAKIILAVVFIVMLFILCINKIDIDKIVVGIGLFYIMTILVEICGILYSRKAGRQDKRAGILYLAPICLLIAIMAISLPSHQDPIQWKGIRQLYKNVKEQIEIWRMDLEYYFSKSDGEFTINYTGYDDKSGDLGGGGNLSKSSRVALMVSGGSGDFPVYLIGSVSDLYTGSSWEKTKTEDNEDQKEYLLDYSELIYALSRQDQKVLDKEYFIGRRLTEIKFQNMKTKTCFYPLKSSSIDVKSAKSKPVMEDGNVKFPKARGKGSSYEIVSYAMNLQGEGFQKMLRDADGFVYPDNPQLEGDSFKWLEENILSEDSITTKDIEESLKLLKGREEKIHELYTTLPDTLPQRVKDLAEDITVGCNTSYDKLRAIEAYLNSYPYTLTPGELPKDRDFVDYFLFDNRKGYCTSFASAMAVLPRCLGIPTRYVEGFVVTYKDAEQSGFYPVKNSQAHAWAEAYIDGVGWIPFEATAPFYEMRYTTWQDKEITAEGNSLDLSEQYAHQRVDGMSDLPPIDNMNNNKEALRQKRNENLLTGAIVILATILIILLIFTTYYQVMRYRYRKVFKKADYSKKMYMLFLRILNLLQKEGFALEQQETIRMLARRVKDKYRIGKITFTNVANIFMSYRYAQAAVTREEFEQVDQFHHELVSRQREKHNRMSLLLDEFVFLARYSNR